MTLELEWIASYIAYARHGGPAHGVRDFGGADDHPLWAVTLCGLESPRSAISCRLCRRVAEARS